MKKTISALIFSSFILIIMSCSQSHFLTDKNYREEVLNDYEYKKAFMPDGNFFEYIENDSLTTREREALKFFYAYMPIGDITDYPADFYLGNFRISEQAKAEMPWGDSVPEILYRHFVLPIRVNNENLDSARFVFYDELKDRVKGLSMKDAILEVNHWCHEKVVYRPSDSRTSSPLASVKTAYGRCGEESTFTVAALRSVGIPARQVYTPRWAHTDDNHAWVEAWADGQWYFLGACEPEPILNMGWFNAPASRGMLMHTKVFGRYNGPEEVMRITPNFVEINVIDNYAPTANAVIKVVDEEGNPVENARVEFRIYNYAEFYPMATKYTDVNGETSLTAGLGDLLIWASADNRFGYDRLSFGKDKELVLKLDKKVGEEYSIAFDIVPPAENVMIPEVTDEQRELNTCRLATEDSIRNAYVITFITEKEIGEFARINQLDSAVITPLILASRGNYGVIMSFLENASTPEVISSIDERNNPVTLLQQISAKDLRDVSREVLDDHLLHSEGSYSGEYYASSVMNPRISNEMLTPYRLYLKHAFNADSVNLFQRNPQELVKWCADNITILDELNTLRIPVSPVGVWNSRVADEKSRDIFFVALARSIGIPSWIDEVTGKVQYRDFSGNRRRDGVTVDADFGNLSKPVSQTGKLIADYETVPVLTNPKYYSHFTLSKYNNGSFGLLNYDEDNSTWESLLKNGEDLDEGYYLQTTGTRLADGSVLANLSFFNINADGTTVIPLTMRKDDDKVQVIGNFNSESTYLPLNSDVSTSFLQTCGRGYYVIGILGVGQEPTNHALKDISAVSDGFDEWGRKMVFLFQNESQYKRFNASEFSNLPSTITYGIDKDNKVLNEIVESLKLPNTTLPVFIITDTFNRVVFVSQGYTIGLGEQMLKVIHGL